MLWRQVLQIEPVPYGFLPAPETWLQQWLQQLRGRHVQALLPDELLPPTRPVQRLHWN
jgi:hypothetical protein